MVVGGRRGPDRLVTAYPLAGLGEDLTAKLARFRVWEAGRRFYVLCPSGTLRVVGFDGKPLWTLRPNVGGNDWVFYLGEEPRQLRRLLARLLEAQGGS